MISRLMHTLHICFRPHLWLLYMISVAAAVGIAISSLNWQPSVTRSFLMGFFEVFGTIAVVLGLHHVLTVDGDEGAQEVLLTYPTSRLILAVERIVAGLLLAAGPLLLLACGYWVFLAAATSDPEFMARSMQVVLAESVVSWLFLAGLALVASSLTGNWVAGLLAGGLYWITDLVTNGRFTSQLYLFNGTFGPATVSQGTNRLLLTVVGILACVGAALTYGRLSSRR